MRTKLTIAIGLAFLLPSCNLTVQPDGTRSWTFNAEAARAIIVYSTK